MNDRLSIALSGKAVTTHNQIAAQTGIIVNLAVKDRPDRLVFVCDWLMSGLQIDDAETAHAESAAAIQMKSFVIRSAVTNCGAHLPHIRKLGGLVAKEKTGDAAHFYSF